VISAPPGTPAAPLTATVSVAPQSQSVTLSTSSATSGGYVRGSSSAGTLGIPNGSCHTPEFTVASNGTVPPTITRT
jgi:hypothetical protein